MSEKENDFNIPEGLTIPEEFYKVIKDFINDIQITFPEYNGIINKWYNNSDLEIDIEKQKIYLFKHCVKIFPERFFDILYKKNEIFDQDNEINTEFLPGIVFKHLWTSEISDSTKEIIWKYLQLILFSVIGSVHDKSQFGDTFKLFESINEEDWKSKLQETLEGMHHLFQKNQEDQQELGSDQDPNKNVNIPNAENIHNHINGMMEGKLGKLAMELAEETAQELNLDMENVSSTQDVFQKLFANPGKLMNMVKNVGGKIDDKIKSGEIKESELISEGVDILNKMKNMPGMENMEEMFSKLGIPGLGKGAKLNTGAMEQKMNQNLKIAKMKERLKMKAELKKQSVSENQKENHLEQTPLLTEEQLISIFSSGEKVEKSLRGSKPENNEKKKKVKSKK